MIGSTGMHRRCWLFHLGFMSALFSVGCGGGGSGPPEALVPVVGTLLVDGEPLDGVVITFIPEIAKNNRGGSGTTGVAGAFTVMDLTQNLPGLAPGKYTVTYSRMRLPDGSAAPEPQAGEPVDPGMIRVETLPPHLLNPDPRDPSNSVEISMDDITDLELKISTE